MVDTVMVSNELPANLQQASEMNLMSQGAEGRLFLSELFGQPCVIKERFVKKYRVPQLDEKLTRSRMLQEVKSMDRVRRMGVPTPGVYLVDLTQRKFYMEYLGQEAMTVKEFLYQLGSYDHPSKCCVLAPPPSFLTFLKDI